MNEYFIMQIVEQVYGIQMVVNGLIFFSDGILVYLMCCFDLVINGRKWGSEDFVLLVGKISENVGFNFKYNFSYEELGMVLW